LPWKGPYGAAALYSTSDGGKSWRRLPDAPGQNVAFRNEEEGWAAATEYKTGAVFYSTVDGGQSWNRHDLPSPGAETESGLFEVPQVRLLPGSGVIAVAGFAAFISVDGGLTWRQLGPMPSRAAYAEIVVQDATHWWTMPAGNLFQTSDGGRSWHHITLRVDEWSWFLGVIDARHAWARLEAPYPRNDPRVGSALAFTADAGKTWTYAKVPRPF
jgi:photosystem II stability/assembly factor-like uncharacterized protein